MFGFRNKAFNFEKSRNDINDLVIGIKSEAVQAGEFNCDVEYKFENRYKFYVSDLEVTYFRAIFVPARFIINDGVNVILVDSGDTLFQTADRKRAPKSFKSVIRLFVLCVIKSLKKEKFDNEILFQMLKNNICNKSENWVKYHGL